MNPSADTAVSQSVSAVQGGGPAIDRAVTVIIDAVGEVLGRSRVDVRIRVVAIPSVSAYPSPSRSVREAGRKEIIDPECVGARPR